MSCVYVFEFTIYIYKYLNRLHFYSPLRLQKLFLLSPRSSSTSSMRKMSENRIFVAWST